MKQGGRAHELARSRITIGVECNTPAKSQACPRPGILSEHTPNTTYEEKDAVSARMQLPTIRALSALKMASRPQWYHRWDLAGTLSLCVRPSVRAPTEPIVARREASYDRKVISLPEPRVLPGEGRAPGAPSAP